MPSSFRNWNNHLLLLFSNWANFILLWKLDELQAFERAPILINFSVITYAEFCGSLQKSESDFFPVMCLYVIYWLHKGTELLYYNYTTDYINVCLCSGIVFTFIHSSRITMTNAIIASFETHYSWSTIKR